MVLVLNIALLPYASIFKVLLPHIVGKTEISTLVQNIFLGLIMIKINDPILQSEEKHSWKSSDHGIK